MPPEVAGDEPKEIKAGPSPLVDYLAKGGLLLGVALVTALLAAIGINQDLLARLLRNDPVALSYAIWAAILGVATPVIGYLFAAARSWLDSSTSRTTDETSTVSDRFRTLKEWSRSPDRIKTTTAALGAVFLTVAAMDTIYYGVQSFGDREQPTVRAEVVGDSSNDKVRVFASAQSLKTSEHMYVRIIAFDESHTSEIDVDRACSNTLTEVPAGARVLYWGQSGAADVKGTANAEVDVSVNRSDFPFLCAHVILTDPKRVTVTTAPPGVYPGSGTCPSADSSTLSDSPSSPASSAPPTAASPPPTACAQVPTKVVIRAGDRYSSLFIDLRNAPVTPEPTGTTPSPTSQPSR